MGLKVARASGDDTLGLVRRPGDDGGGGGPGGGAHVRKKNQVLTEWADKPKPPGLEGVHFKRTATWKAHRFWLKAPGDATAEIWESFTPQDVIFDHFTAR